MKPRVPISRSSSFIDSANSDSGHVSAGDEWRTYVLGHQGSKTERCVRNRSAGTDDWPVWTRSGLSRRRAEPILSIVRST